MNEKQQTTTKTPDKTQKAEPLTPEQIAAALYGPAKDFTLATGSTYSTEQDGATYTGQRIARASVPLLLNGQPSGYTLPVNINRLTSAEGDEFITISMPRIGQSRDGKGGKPGIEAEDRALTNALRDKIAADAAAWYRNLGTEAKNTKAPTFSKPRLVKV